ncbi:hypothetical protein M8C21_017804, partial [Ambrosia artemisiifolia]
VLIKHTHTNYVKTTPHIVSLMNILLSLALLIHFSTHFHGHCTTNNLQLGAERTVVLPSQYMNGFVVPTYILETSGPVPSFRAGLMVWSSSHLSRFFTTEKCVISLTWDGDLRLTGQNGQIGWQTATHGQEAAIIKQWESCSCG